MRSGMHRAHPVLPYAAVLGAIALLSLMDAVMKGASLMIGAYSTLVVRSVFGLALAAPLWLRSGTGWPAPAVVRLHVLRGVVVTGMSFTFFWGLTRLPLAEAIAISFTAPLVALYLAALLLGERVGKGAIAASLMGLVGVVVIAAGRMEGDGTPASGWGMAAVLLSSLLYALNLVLQRKQALVARPAEVSTFHQGVVLLSLALFAPWFLQRPDLAATGLSAAAAVLSVVGAMIFAWAYARAETQALAPLEYSGFLWAGLFGWLFFREPVTLPTLAGAALIVLGCWIAAPKKRPEQSAA
jgi:S-adenosylmethionine uptake transporter